MGDDTHRPCKAEGNGKLSKKVSKNERRLGHFRAAPPRNCDVGTAEEQAERQSRFCLSQRGCSPACPAFRKGQGHNGCVLTWAQMPYEGEERKEDV